MWLGSTSKARRHDCLTRLATKTRLPRLNGFGAGTVWALLPPALLVPVVKSRTVLKMKRNNVGTSYNRYYGAVVLFLFIIAISSATLCKCAATQTNVDFQVSAAELQKRKNALAESDNLIVPGERIGPIRIGMAIDEVSAKLGKPDYQIVDKDTFWFFWDLNLEVRFDGASKKATHVFTQVNQGKISPDGTEILPLQTVFKTSSGIGLGATAADVRRAYGSYEGHTPMESWRRFPKIGMQLHLVEGRVSEISVLRAQEY